MSIRHSSEEDVDGIYVAIADIPDAFIPPKPEGNWSLNEETCLWERVK